MGNIGVMLCCSQVVQTLQVNTVAYSFRYQASLASPADNCAPLRTNSSPVQEPLPGWSSCQVGALPLEWLAWSTAAQSQLAAPRLLQLLLYIFATLECLPDM